MSAVPFFYVDADLPQCVRVCRSTRQRRDLVAVIRRECEDVRAVGIFFLLNAFGKSVFGYNVFTLVLSNHFNVKASGITHTLCGLPGKNMWKVEQPVRVLEALGIARKLL